jgi:16S rRNA (cytosine1407-C5)-methyltransferase
MKQDFLDYIQETFKFSPLEMMEFSCALSQPLWKTIRVNTNKISIKDFKNLAMSHDWVLRETPLWNNMFYIDREDTSLALWHTLEHIAGYFYVQELAASSSPFYMSENTINENEYLILDMSASPGWKTTQLAEYYPNSLIIANEIDKSRMRQLHENTDRLWAKNVFVTNYDGRYFGNFPEMFDKILLDAPCSWEGTAYKTDDALKYWNLKNIKRIAKLQFQLLEHAFITLKVWGELVYSTCTLNRLENEEIINKLTLKYGDYFRIISLSEDLQNPIIRAWPHKNNTWWFFVAKLIKKESIPDIKISKKIQKNTQWFEKLSNTSEKLVKEFLTHNFWLSLSGKFFTYRDEIYYSEKYDEILWENFFMYKCGIKIGKIESWEFIPNFFLGTNFWIFVKNKLEIDTEKNHALLKWEEMQNENPDGYYQILLWSITAWIVKIKWWVMKSLLESRFMRK